jgi:hypothetical protein
MLSTDLQCSMELPTGYSYCIDVRTLMAKEEFMNTL